MRVRRLVAWMMLAGAAGAFGTPGPDHCDPILVDLTVICPEPAPTPEPIPSPITNPRDTVTVSAATGSILAVSADSTRLGRIDVSGAVTGCIDLNSRADIVDATPDGSKLFFADRVNRELASIDAATGEELAHVELAGEPLAMDVSADGERLSVVSTDMKVVEVRDTATLELVATIELSGDPTAIAALSDPSKVAVTLTVGTIALIDIETGQVTQSGVIFVDPSSIQPCELPAQPIPAPQPTAGESVIVTDRATGTMVVVDTATMEVIDVAPAPVESPERSVGAVVTDPSAQIAYDLSLVIGSESRIAVIDCDPASPGYLRGDCDIVTAGEPLPVSATTTLTASGEQRIGVGMETRETLVLVDPTCLVSGAHIDGLSRTAVVPGSTITVSGTGLSAETRFVVSADTEALFYLALLDAAEDGTSARVKIPLDAPFGVELVLAVTPSSAEAVLERQVYIRCGAKTFHSLTFEGGVAVLLDQLEGILETTALSRQARNRLENAIHHLSQIIHLLDQGRHNIAQGDMEEAFEKNVEIIEEHLPAALDALRGALERGAPVGDKLSELAELAQFMTHLDIEDFLDGVPEAGAHQGELVALMEQGAASMQTTVGLGEALARFQEAVEVLEGVGKLPPDLDKFKEPPPGEPPTAPPHEPCDCTITITRTRPCALSAHSADPSIGGLNRGTPITGPIILDLTLTFPDDCRCSHIDVQVVEDATGDTVVTERIPCTRTRWQWDLRGRPVAGNVYNHCGYSVTFTAHMSDGHTCTASTKVHVLDCDVLVSRYEQRADAFPRTSLGTADLRTLQFLMAARVAESLCTGIFESLEGGAPPPVEDPCRLLCVMKDLERRIPMTPADAVAGTCWADYYDRMEPGARPGLAGPMQALQEFARCHDVIDLGDAMRACGGAFQPADFAFIRGAILDAADQIAGAWPEAITRDTFLSQVEVILDEALEQARERAEASEEEE